MRILNVGCGTDTYGTDFVDVYPTRPEVKRMDIESGKLPFSENTFDEIYAKFVFEHMKNPGKFLQEAKRVLKKGGKITIITDNAGCWAFHFPFDISLSRQHYDNTLRHGDADRHYALFTPLHLQNHINAVGFRNAQVSYMWFEDYTSTQTNKLLFVLLSAFARAVSLVTSQKISYPHLRVVAVK